MLQHKKTPLSFTISWSWLKFMSIESMMLSISSSVAPFSFCLQFFPASGSFPVSWLFASGGQRIGTSASASVLPMNIQGLFPLGLTGLIPIWSVVQGTLKNLLQHHNSVASVLWHSAFFMVQLSHLYMTTEKKNIDLTTQIFVSKVMSLVFNILSKVCYRFSSKEQ